MGLPLRISLALCVAPVGALAMGLIGSGPPSGMVLTDAAHITNPVVVQSLEINGRNYGAPPYMASTDWENPRGGNTTLTDLAPPIQDGNALLVRAEWVEAYTNHSYSASLSVPDGKLVIEDRTRPTAMVTVVYGANGHLAISTDTGPDAVSGQYNGTIVAEICGIRGDDFDVRDGDTLRSDLDWIFSQQAERADLPRIDTPCAGEES